MPDLTRGLDHRTFSQNMDRQMRMAGQMHTPTQSFNDSILDTNLETPAFKLPPTNEKKLKEDVEHTKARLTDQRFNISESPTTLPPSSVLRAAAAAALPSPARLV